jgi:nitroreductase
MLFPRLQKMKNPTLETIFNHRSIREFRAKKVPRKLINQIVEAGQRAPTACGMQTYSFVLITDPKVREKLFEVIGRQKCMEQAPAWIVVCADVARQLELFKILRVKTDFGPLGKLVPSVIDASLAAQNMMLAAESLGLGTVFIGSIWDVMKKVAEILQVPKDVLPMLLLCIGYPDEMPPTRPRWPLKAVLHENCYTMPSRKLMEQYYRKANKELVEMQYFSKGVESWAEHWQRKFPKEGVGRWEAILEQDLTELGFLPK